MDFKKKVRVAVFTSVSLSILFYFFNASNPLPYKIINVERNQWIVVEHGHEMIYLLQSRDSTNSPFFKYYFSDSAYFPIRPSEFDGYFSLSSQAKFEISGVIFYQIGKDAKRIGVKSRFLKLFDSGLNVIYLD